MLTSRPRLSVDTLERVLELMARFQVTSLEMDGTRIARAVVIEPPLGEEHDSEKPKLPHERHAPEVTPEEVERDLLALGDF